MATAIMKPSDPHKYDYQILIDEVLLSETDEYKVLQYIGKGSFGVVVKCMKKRSNEFVAIKILRNHIYYSDLAEDEIDILRKLSLVNADEFNFVRTYEWFIHKNHKCLVFELLKQNLFEFLQQNSFQALPLKYIRPILQQLLTALLKLQELSIIHTDIKPENIMLVEPAKHPLRVKIIDFGTSKLKLAPRMPYRICLQSRYYRAPEMILGSAYTDAIDIWSLGSVMAELFLGWPLYPGATEYDMLRYITETQGFPSLRMLENGTKTRSFFCHETNSSHPFWRLKTSLEYEAETGHKFKETRKYQLMSLDQVPMYRVANNMEDNLMETELFAEGADREVFSDLLKQMLMLDEEDRITPAEALNHNFMTLNHLRGYAHCRNVINSRMMMDEICRQNQQSFSNNRNQVSTVRNFSSASNVTPDFRNQFNNIPNQSASFHPPIPQITTQRRSHRAQRPVTTVVRNQYVDARAHSVQHDLQSCMNYTANNVVPVVQAAPLHVQQSHLTEEFHPSSVYEHVSDRGALINPLLCQQAVAPAAHVNPLLHQQIVAPAAQMNPLLHQQAVAPAAHVNPLLRQQAVAPAATSSLQPSWSVVASNSNQFHSAVLPSQQPQSHRCSQMFSNLPSSSKCQPKFRTKLPVPTKEREWPKTVSHDVPRTVPNIITISDSDEEVESSIRTKLPVATKEHERPKIFFHDTPRTVPNVITISDSDEEVESTISYNKKQSKDCGKSKGNTRNGSEVIEKDYLEETTGKAEDSEAIDNEEPNIAENIFFNSPSVNSSNSDCLRHNIKSIKPLEVEIPQSSFLLDHSHDRTSLEDDKAIDENYRQRKELPSALLKDRSHSSCSSPNCDDFKKNYEGIPSCSTKNLKTLSKSNESVEKKHILKQKKRKSDYLKQKKLPVKVIEQKDVKSKSCNSVSLDESTSQQENTKVLKFPYKKSSTYTKKKAAGIKLKMPKMVCVHVNINRLSIDEICRASSNEQNKNVSSPKRRKSQRLATYKQKSSTESSDY